MNKIVGLFSLTVGLFFLYTKEKAWAQTNTAPTTPVVVIGQDESNRAITTAVPFLNITPDARAAGLGDTGVASSPDVNSAYWNPGKLAFIEQDYGVSLSYTPWLAKIINDMKLIHLSAFKKLGREQAFGISMKYFDLGEIQFRDNAAQDIGRYNPREFAIDVTYSRNLTENFGIGGNLRYIYSNLVGSGLPGSDTKPGNSVAVDIGVFYRHQLLTRNASYAIGAAVTNIGAKMTYSDANNADFIPMNLRVGGNFKTYMNPQNSISFSLDFNKLLVPSPHPGANREPLLSALFSSFSDASGGFAEEIREITASAGVEYWYRDFFAGRVGYFYEAADKGNRKYFTAGLGFRYLNYGLDVAYLVPTNKRESALAETIRFTIMATFAKKKQNKGESITN